MADLNDSQAAQSVKIIGSDSTGAEQIPVESTSNGKLKIAVHDQNGDDFTIRNPLSVTGNIEKFFLLVSSSNWMKLGNYDNVVPVFSGANNEVLTLSYKEGGNTIGTAIIDYTSDIDWEVTLSKYIIDDSGASLLDDDGTILNLD
jgi:hypothetical protein